MLEAEADRLCNAGRYERTAARRDQRSGSYDRKLQTTAGEVTLKAPKLRMQTFETAIIERMDGLEHQGSFAQLAGRDVAAQEDLAAAQRKTGEVVARLHNMRLGKAAELVEIAGPETLAYYAFPEEHWRRIRTNNPLERIMREIRRRTRVVGAFPDGNSALNLAAARLRHIAGTRWSTKRYLNMELLRQRNAMIA